VQFHQPRLAELVAEVLKGRIVRGELPDGALLPRQEDLLHEFRVGRPTLREAMRVLEAEGLITIRRGNRGGATVHAPRVGSAAYSVGLVMQSRGVEMADLRGALQAIEPVCAGLCAARADRYETVLPVLRALHQRALDMVTDPVQFTVTSRQFHEGLVDSCGNETLKVVVGTLDLIWASREQEWARDTHHGGGFPDYRHRVRDMKAHERIIRCIEDGDVDGAKRRAGLHLESGLARTRQCG
jgi:GntR family transcriptional regulator, transcriptional repressor for pyruvate dehydrogenase complex